MTALHLDLPNFIRRVKNRKDSKKTTINKGKDTGAMASFCTSPVHHSQRCEVIKSPDPPSNSVEDLSHPSSGSVNQDNGNIYAQCTICEKDKGLGEFSKSRAATKHKFINVIKTSESLDDFRCCKDCEILIKDIYRREEQLNLSYKALEDAKALIVNFNSSFRESRPFFHPKDFSSPPSGGSTPGTYSCQSSPAGSRRNSKSSIILKLVGHSIAKKSSPRPPPLSFECIKMDLDVSDSNSNISVATKELNSVARQPDPSCTFEDQSKLEEPVLVHNNTGNNSSGTDLEHSQEPETEKDISAPLTLFPMTGVESKEMIIEKPKDSNVDSDTSNSEIDVMTVKNDDVKQPNHSSKSDDGIDLQEHAFVHNDTVTYKETDSESPIKPNRRKVKSVSPQRSLSEIPATNCENTMVEKLKDGNVDSDTSNSNIDFTTTKNDNFKQPNHSSKSDDGTELPEPEFVHDDTVTYSKTNSESRNTKKRRKVKSVSLSSSTSGIPAKNCENTLMENSECSNVDSFIDVTTKNNNNAKQPNRLSKSDDGTELLEPVSVHNDTVTSSGTNSESPNKTKRRNGKSASPTPASVIPPINDEKPNDDNVESDIDVTTMKNNYAKRTNRSSKCDGGSELQETVFVHNDTVAYLETDSVSPNKAKRIKDKSASPLTPASVIPAISGENTMVEKPKDGNFKQPNHSSKSDDGTELPESEFVHDDTVTYSETNSESRNTKKRRKVKSVSLSVSNVGSDTSNPDINVTTKSNNYAKRITRSSKCDDASELQEPVLVHHDTVNYSETGLETQKKSKRRKYKSASPLITATVIPVLNRKNMTEKPKNSKLDSDTSNSDINITKKRKKNDKHARLASSPETEKDILAPFNLFPMTDIESKEMMEEKQKNGKMDSKSSYSNMNVTTKKRENDKHPNPAPVSDNKLEDLSFLHIDTVSYSETDSDPSKKPKRKKIKLTSAESPMRILMVVDEENNGIVDSNTNVTKKRKKKEKNLSAASVSDDKFQDASFLHSQTVSSLETDLEPTKKPKRKKVKTAAPGSPLQISATTCGEMFVEEQNNGIDNFNTSYSNINATTKRKKKDKHSNPNLGSVSDDKFEDPSFLHTDTVTKAETDSEAQKKTNRKQVITKSPFVSLERIPDIDRKVMIVENPKNCNAYVYSDTSDSDINVATRGKQKVKQPKRTPTSNDGSKLQESALVGNDNDTVTYSETDLETQKKSKRKKVKSASSPNCTLQISAATCNKRMVEEHNNGLVDSTRNVKTKRKKNDKHSNHASESDEKLRDLSFLHANTLTYPETDSEPPKKPKCKKVKSTSPGSAALRISDGTSTDARTKNPKSGMIDLHTSDSQLNMTKNAIIKQQEITPAPTYEYGSKYKNKLVQKSTKRLTCIESDSDSDSDNPPPFRKLVLGSGSVSRNSSLVGNTNTPVNLHDRRYGKQFSYNLSKETSLPSFSNHSDSD